MTVCVAGLNGLSTDIMPIFPDISLFEFTLGNLEINVARVLLRARKRRYLWQ